ncbi:MAG TPA: PAS domain-containing protein [Steroidobacteraceae bacterium]|nr:PAS domain-containing protein [Steroidobacteraceae bacterium]
MPATPNEPAKHSKLRSDAETRLKDGSAPPTTGWSVGVNALGLLHKLASSPASAIDALKLLHELQVHQVELDLQHEQIEANQRELVDDLACFQRLYENAPVAYVNLSPQRDILDCNIAGAQLFEVTPDELRGRDIDSLLAPASRPVFLQLLKRLRSDGTSASCEVQLNIAYGSAKFQVVACAAAGGHSFLVVFVDLPAPR